MAKTPARSRRPFTTAQAPLSDQPWWVRSIVWVGVPSAGLAFMLWFFVGNFDRRMQQHQDDLAKLVIEIQAQTKLDQQKMETQLNQAWVQLGVMQRICLNTSKTDADRIACASLTQRAPP